MSLFKESDRVRRTPAESADGGGESPRKELIDPNLMLKATVLKELSMKASSAADQSHLMDELQVVWMWINKDPDPPEHEYIVVETVDRKQFSQFFLSRNNG